MSFDYLVVVVYLEDVALLVLDSLSDSESLSLSSSSLSSSEESCLVVLFLDCVLDVVVYTGF